MRQKKSSFTQRNPLDAVYRIAKMSRVTNFVRPWLSFKNTGSTKIHRIFMVPKPIEPRLSTSMQPIDTSWQRWAQPAGPAAFGIAKEPQLKLSLETRNRGDVMVVHCQGRIVYRDEAAALSRLVGEVLQHAGKLVLDLSGVNSMDSAGIGELALLQTWAQERNANLKVAGANSLVRTLLDLTNLDSVIEVHPTLDSALESFREEPVSADC
jgi:anti-sigma B factor antagonist